MPRAIWSGSVAFGLVNVPVRMYSAIAEHDLELHLVHETDGSRIGFTKICKLEEKEVPADEIVKAYDTGDGKLVYLTDEDFEAASGELYKVVEIMDFVAQAEIDPIVFERTYYLGPADGAEKVYALLVRAMSDSGLAAIAKYVFHDRQRLGCLRIRDGVLTLENLYFADEIRPIEGIAPRGRKVDKQELAMAMSLIEKFTRPFDHDRYVDKYQDALRAVVRRKKRGDTITPRIERRSTEAPDLLEALRASVESAKAGSKSRKPRAESTELANATVAELRDRAAQLEIRGRSSMSKRELVGAISKAG